MERRRKGWRRGRERVRQLEDDVILQRNGWLKGK